MEKRRKPFSPRQPVTRLHIDDTASTEYTLLEVDAPDTLGLVYRFAALLGGIGWNIHAARCTVWGGHVRCAFYLTDSAGNALPAPKSPPASKNRSRVMGGLGGRRGQVLPPQESLSVSVAVALNGRSGAAEVVAVTSGEARPLRRRTALRSQLTGARSHPP